MGADLTVLRNLVVADVALAAIPNTYDGADAIAKVLNAETVTPYFVWRNSVDSAALNAAIDWGKFFPVDACDGTVVWLNRATMCELKQRGIVALLSASPVHAAFAQVRQSFVDCLTGIPSGPGGAMRDAGVASVSAAAQRHATRYESEVAVNGTGAPGNPATLTFEGSVSVSEIAQALGY